MKNVLGIDIGGTKIAVCLANEKGEILGSERFPSTKTCEEAVDRIASLANDLLEMKEMTMAESPRPAPSTQPKDSSCAPRTWDGRTRARLHSISRKSSESPPFLKTTPTPVRWRSGSSAMATASRT